MKFLQSIFTTVPWFVLAIVLVGYVFRRTSGFSWKTRFALTLVATFGCSRFLVGYYFFGSSFYAELPELLHGFWCWLYVGIVFLAIISIVTWSWKAHCRVWLLPTIAFVLAAIGFWNAVKLPVVHEIELPFADLPSELEGYRIVQLSDLHASAAARRWRTEEIVSRANALNADIICMTGDYVDGGPSQRYNDVEPIRRLKAKDGVWFVTGNHEYYFDRPGWAKVYRDWKLNFLDSECVFPRKSLALAGVPDPALGRKRGKVKIKERMPSVARAFAAATNGEFRVLLQHQPKWALNNVHSHGVRLQLSGHTHGGIMPGIFPVVRRGNRGFLADAYQIDKSWLYVSRGIGQWAGFQLRFFNPAEIVVITLRRSGHIGKQP